MKLKLLFKIISFIGLLLTLLPSYFVFIGKIDLNTDKLLMLIGTVVWFLISPFWINKEEKA